jgi:hypothetical protein
MAHRKATRGSRVAHATIDSETGLARTGVVEDVIRDEDGALVAARWDDAPNTLEAFDEREIVPLVGSKRGPVILHLRHLVALFKRPSGALAMLGALLCSLSIGFLADLRDWEPSTTLLAGAAIIAVMLAGAVIAERRSRRRR